MLKRIALLVAVSALLVSFAGSAGAITGNYQKDFTHDAVGLLVFYTTPDRSPANPFSHRCSGTLISPTVMVTAGHCTEGVDTGRVYFAQSRRAELRPERVRRLRAATRRRATRI